MAEVGSIRGGDGSIPGEEDVEVKKEPQFLQPLVATAVAGSSGDARVLDTHDTSAIITG